MCDEKGWGAKKGGNAGSYRIYREMKKFGFIEMKQNGTKTKIWIREDKIPYQWKKEIRGTLRNE
jgi:hypothetical protein